MPLALPHLSDIDGLYFLIPLLLLPGLISLVLKTFKRSSSSKLPPLPPGPTPWPIVGNIPHIGNMPHETFANFSKTYGDLISVKLGTKLLIVGSSPAAAAQILKTNDRILSGRHVPYAYPYTRSELNNISMGWTQQCDDRWRKLRNHARTELFSGKALESQEVLRAKKVTEMVELLKANQGNVMDIGQLSFATTLNVISNALLSRDLIGLQEGMSDKSMKVLLRGMIDITSAPNLSDFYPILNKLDLQGLNKKAKKIWRELWSRWEPVVEEKRKRKNGSSSTPRDFLDTLIENDFSDDGILELLAEIFLASTDTSTSTVEWMMAELVRNPESMKIVREEIEHEFNQGELKESQLMNLPYLQACFKETMRMHPPVPLLVPHRALETCQIMNYTIPKNAQIFVNVWAIARDPKIWDEPSKFKPERFVNSSMDYKGNSFEYLPFGSGRRICPGLPMAARHVNLVVASLVHSFDWSLPGGKKPDELDMTEMFGVALQKEQPLLLIPQARK